MTGRNLLLILDDSPYSTDLPSSVDRPHLTPPPPTTSSSSSHPPEKPPRQQPLPNAPFDSSIPLTIIVLLTALFVMAFFSLYVRCFSGSDPSNAPASPHRRGGDGSRPPHQRSLHHGAPSSASKVGADADVVRSLPVVVYGAGGGEYPYDQSDCAVCLSEFEEGETVKVIPRCRHVFHPECLDTWLSSHVSCPVCRTNQLAL